MEVTQFRYLLLVLLLTCGLAPEVAAEVEESSDDPRAPRGPVWLTNVPAAMEFIAAVEVAVIGFFQDLEIPIVPAFHSMVQEFPDVSFGISNDSEVFSHYNITGNTISLFRLVDNEQLKLEGEELESIDATKLSHFISINNLRWVTEYNSMTGSGLFNSQIEIHLLLIIDKASPEYEKNMHRYQEAAKLFQKKVLFVLVDSGVMENQRAISYFRLKMSQLPALAIYRTVDDKWDTLPIKEVTLEQVQNFYDGFLEGKLLKESDKSEEKTPKEEL
ncbi:endoplasmic reticulum resident protein 27 isoform X2 [Cavia porcellus]|uniref:endoplasmic reticulum resident protein 27 isoform X2 n=1 Tax=Cavia porcellus TaxID=10141 RepID=UPI000184E270|nr:endoplasmic reticulum resident protein 27 [Cavia porcellus]